MFPDPPPGWDALQERAKQARTADELASVIDEMNRLLTNYERAAGYQPNLNQFSDHCDSSGTTKVA